MNTTTLTTKDYLSQAYRIDRRINSMLEQVRSLRALAEKVSATLSDTPASRDTRHVHRLEDTIAKMLDLESEIRADLERLVDLKCETVTAIRRVENPELQLLLELRYLCFKTWPEISVELQHDKRWIQRLHNKALGEIDKFKNKNGTRH